MSMNDDVWGWTPEHDETAPAAATTTAATAAAVSSSSEDAVGNDTPGSAETGEPAAQEYEPQYDPEYDPFQDMDFGTADVQYADVDVPVQYAPRKDDLSQRVLEALRSTLSAAHRMTPEDAVQLVQRIEASSRVLDQLGDETADVYVGVLEVLLHECSVLSTGRLDLGCLPVAAEYSPAVQAELGRISGQVGVSTPEDPHAHWADLVEGVQRVFSRRQAQSFVSSLDDKRPVVALMEAFRKIEPPTTKKAVSRVHGAKTAKQVANEARAALAGQAAFRFSSGLPTLDAGYTGSGEPLGFVSPGTFNVVMGPTGTGKSSFSYAVTPAFGLDMVNWGLRDAKQVFFHTEEESVDKLKGFRMDVGDKYHHLADNLIIDAIGTSRKRMAETLYDLVVIADEQARETKRPITEFLPYLMQLDYIQSIQESGEDPTTASAITAEFCLRGVCAWNPEEMAKFSGVDFREYAGMAWPKGMENHRVAVIAYAQLIKVSDETMYFKADKRGIQLSDFALLDGKDEPYWDVREGDLRLFGKNQMRGSGIIAQNAHSIVILHRSVPYNNPSYKDADGNFKLTDTRARILFDKSRAGSRAAYAPMDFDVQSTGFRAQYFDCIAVKALEAGRLANIDPSYVEPGDPMLPRRDIRNPLAECRY
jgi:hypothetical protein